MLLQPNLEGRKKSPFLKFAIVKLLARRNLCQWTADHLELPLPCAGPANACRIAGRRSGPATGPPLVPHHVPSSAKLWTWQASPGTSCLAAAVVPECNTCPAHSRLDLEKAAALSVLHTLPPSSFLLLLPPSCLCAFGALLIIASHLSLFPAAAKFRVNACEDADSRT